MKNLAPSARRGLSPLQIVRAVMPYTPFDAVIVLAEEDGTFLLGERAGASRRAFRIAPLTRAERLLGEREPARLLDLLRAAGALVSDPFRACVVEPTRDGGRRANLAELLRRERRKVQRSIERLEDTVAKNAPDCLIDGAKFLLAWHQAELASLESSVPAIFPEADPLELRAEETLNARYVQLFDDLLAFSADPYAGLVPPPVRRLFRTFTFLVVGRHPWVTPIQYEAVIGEGREGANFEPVAEDIRFARFVDSLVSCMPHMFPESNLKATTARARAVAKQAKGALDPGSDDPWEIRAWSITATAVCLHAAPLDPEDVPAAERALREAGDLCARRILEVGRDGAPARLRLARIAATISRTLYRSFVRASPPMTSTGAPLN